MNRLKFLCVLVSAVVTFIPNQAAALTSNQVEDIARQISVKILSPNIRNPAENEFIGTGFIILSLPDTNTYYVLTAKHIASGSKETKYILVTADGNSYEVNPGDIQDLSNMDLSLLKFVSDQTYQQARLGESDRLNFGDSIYIYGWVSRSREKFVTGRFRQLIEQENNSRDDSDLIFTDGYGITYDAQTENGMSGSPILDTDGRLVGIHGRDNRFYKLGIPIETFLNSLSVNL
jgi:serine protease Do